ncbi:hypothetical protein GCM10022248_76510 [Nonomuraea soli]
MHDVAGLAALVEQVAVTRRQAHGQHERGHGADAQQHGARTLRRGGLGRLGGRLTGRLGRLTRTGLPRLTRLTGVRRLEERARAGECRQRLRAAAHGLVTGRRPHLVVGTHGGPLRVLRKPLRRLRGLLRILGTLLRPLRRTLLLGRRLPVRLLRLLLGRLRLLRLLGLPLAGRGEPVLPGIVHLASRE